MFAYTFFNLARQSLSAFKRPVTEGAEDVTGQEAEGSVRTRLPSAIARMSSQCVKRTGWQPQRDAAASDYRFSEGGRKGTPFSSKREMGRSGW